MSGIINYMISLPFEVRVALCFFLLVFVFWNLLCKKILLILSIFPFFLVKIFRVFYLLVQEILSVLHKKIGWIFVSADEEFVKIGEKIDDKIMNWHKKWKSAEKPQLKECFIIYIICCLVVILPYYVPTSNRIMKVGENGFLNCEKFILEYIQDSEWYDSQEKFDLRESLLQEVSVAEPFKSEKDITLIVAGLKSSLTVRDIPEGENSVILDRLYNDDCVIWSGEIVFSTVDNRVEPWVKITMENGVTGWSRMDYLYPSEYEDIIYRVTQIQKEQ